MVTARIYVVGPTWMARALHATSPKSESMNTSSCEAVPMSGEVLFKASDAVVWTLICGLLLTWCTVCASPCLILIMLADNILRTLRKSLLDFFCLFFRTSNFLFIEVTYPQILFWNSRHSEFVSELGQGTEVLGGGNWGTTFGFFKYSRATHGSFNSSSVGMITKHLSCTHLILITTMSRGYSQYVNNRHIWILISYGKLIKLLAAYYYDDQQWYSELQMNGQYRNDQLVIMNMTNDHSHCIRGTVITGMTTWSLCIWPTPVVTIARVWSLQEWPYTYYSYYGCWSRNDHPVITQMTKTRIRYGHYCYDHPVINVIWPTLEFYAKKGMVNRVS